MRITAVKGWYPLHDPQSFPIGPSHSGDLEDAIREEHSCDSSACDICQALDAGFPTVAAQLLGSATETPLLVAVDLAHRFNGTAGSFDSEAEWNRWLDYWAEAQSEGRLWRCQRCGAFNWDSDTCGDCLSHRGVGYKGGEIDDAELS